MNNANYIETVVNLENQLGILKGRVSTLETMQLITSLIVAALAFFARPRE